MSTLLTKRDFLFDANYNVRTNHKYYCQIQLEMYVCGVLYCDVVIWQPDSILVVRVQRDDSFLTDMLPNLRTAWIKHILPELLTKSIQSAPKASASAATCTVTTASASGNDYEFCVCKTDIGGRMIGCDNSDCPYKWFHLSCLKLKRVPRKSPWLCKFCEPPKSAKRMKK